MPDRPMLKEEFLHMLMGVVYDKNSLNIYDYTANNFPPDGDEFRQCSDWSDQLVQEKLAVYTDKERTTIHLTNYGRYWMLQGGYEAFLREGQRKRDIKKLRDLEKEKLTKEKEELLEARIKLTHFRLWGFWLTLIISCIGFTLSLFNLYLILRNKN